MQQAVAADEKLLDLDFGLSPLIEDVTEGPSSVGSGG
jgi:hypothetical protein